MSEVDQNVDAVKSMLDRRSVAGTIKYGVTTDKAGLSVLEWLRHLQEELLDAAVYIEALTSGDAVSQPAPKYRAFRTAKEALPLLGEQIQTPFGLTVVVAIGGDQPQRYQYLRDRAHSLARALLLITSPSREQSLALTHLEQAVFWANAGIARNGDGKDKAPLS